MSTSTSAPIPMFEQRRIEAMLLKVVLLVEASAALPKARPVAAKG